MTIVEFCDGLETHWPMRGGRQILDDGVLANWSRALERFTDAERDRLFFHLVGACVHQPRIAELYQAAEACHVYQERHEAAPRFTFDQLKPSGCPYCDGTGLVWAVLDFQSRKIMTVRPPSRQREIEAAPYLALFRCHCDMGDRVPAIPVLPKETKKPPKSQPED